MGSDGRNRNYGGGRSLKERLALQHATRIKWLASLAKATRKR